MNKLYTTLLIACLAAGFTACNDDDCEDLHLGNLAHYPNVLKGTFPTESQSGRSQLFMAGQWKRVFYRTDL